jgi:hypothetical protein
MNFKIFRKNGINYSPRMSDGNYKIYTEQDSPQTPLNNFENTLIYSMLDFNFMDMPSIDHNEPAYSE